MQSGEEMVVMRKASQERGEGGEIARKIGENDGGLAEENRGLKKIEFLECNHS